MSAEPDIVALPWDQRQRFRFIEAHVIWLGQVRVADVREGFDVTTGRAEKDLLAYQRLSPGNLMRDRRTGELQDHPAQREKRSQHRHPDHHVSPIWRHS